MHLGETLSLLTLVDFIFCGMTSSLEGFYVHVAYFACKLALSPLLCG
jgi:hypothetical protein